MLRQDNEVAGDNVTLRERVPRLETIMDITVKNLTADIANLKLHYDQKINEQTAQLQRQMNDLQTQVRDLSKLIAAKQTPEAQDQRLYWVLIAVGVTMAIFAVAAVGVWIRLGRLPIPS